MPASKATVNNGIQGESPHYVRLSLAAAMTLGFTNGWFYRHARLGCINLLLTYAGGCRANCAFCGLAAGTNSSNSGQNFIRVLWRNFSTDKVIEAIKRAPEYVQRVCVSMITHPRCRQDVLEICRRVSEETGKAVSLLISPSLMHRGDLATMKEAGAERIGVAIDGATKEIFERLRSKTVRGPHQWERYWRVYSDSLEVFGNGMAGVHLIFGLGETEKEMVAAIAKARIMGGSTHLFSFFPEKGSAMETHPSPPIGAYRRIQLARWLIDNDQSSFETMQFDRQGKIRQFGLCDNELSEIIQDGSSFETSGCPGSDGRVACNRPYGNEKPGTQIRNFPFPPEEDDLKRIKEELQQY